MADACLPTIAVTEAAAAAAAVVGTGGVQCDALSGSRLLLLLLLLCLGQCCVCLLVGWLQYCRQVLAGVDLLRQC